MRHTSSPSLVSFVIPDGMLLLAALALLRPTGLPKWTGTLILTYDYLVLAGAIVLAWYVGLSRVMIATLLLAIVDGTLSRFPGMSLTDSSGDRVQRRRLPAPDEFSRAVAHRGTPVRPPPRHRMAGAIFVQACLVLWLCFSQKSRTPLPRGVAALCVSRLGATRWTALSQPALLAFIADLFLVSARFILHGNRLDRGFVWALMAVFLALHGMGLGWSPTNFLATAALILIVSVYADEYRLSHYDEVTGVSGRDAFYEALRDVTGRYALAVVDIDEMKRINERYGDAIRDKTLQLVARKLSRIRRGDTFRYDRDKFAVLFHGKSAADVLPRLEALRAAVQGMSVPVSGTLHTLMRKRAIDPAHDQPLVVTISIGVAEPSPNLTKPEQVFKRAEQALLRAKQAGRNEVRALA